jgi:hypothetical protein
LENGAGGNSNVPGVFRPLSVSENSNSFQRLSIGGEGGIRTPDTVARMPHFECGAFNRSATSPETSHLWRDNPLSPKFTLQVSLLTRKIHGGLAGVAQAADPA